MYQMKRSISKPPLVLLSADAEWRAVKHLLRPRRVGRTPFGETFLQAGARWLQGGWGKISAAASAQYALDRCRPPFLANLGTCGGFAGKIEPGALLLVEQTFTYDIVEQIGEAEAALQHYAVSIDTSWLGRLPAAPAVERGPIVSADRDILPADLPWLSARFGARAADWESSAIAWVAQRNACPVLLLRGVSDLVSESAAEAYGNPALFETRSLQVMTDLLAWWHAWRELNATCSV